MAKKVLIIDDDPDIVKVLTVAMEANGYETASAGDGTEGLKQVKADKPDIIILDVMMPKKTGFVLFKQLRRDDQYKDIPILMLTGVADSLAELESRKEDTFESPFDSLRASLKKAIQEMREEGLVKPEMFIDKPVDPEQVVEKVKGLIGE